MNRMTLMIAAALVAATLPAAAASDSSVAGNTLTMAFTPDPARTTGATSPEGCEIEPGAPQGTLGGPTAGGACHVGSWGEVFTGDFYPGVSSSVMPAEFTSSPFDEDVVLGEDATIVVYAADPTWGDALRLDYVLSQIATGGSATIVSSGAAIPRVVQGRNEVAFKLVRSGTVIAAGARLRFRMHMERMLFGGANYGDAGITLTTGAAPQEPVFTFPNLTPGRPAFIGAWAGKGGDFGPIDVVGGCTPDERVESGARQCLRFDGIIENRGVGTMEMRWDVVEQTGEKRAWQRVYRNDGTFEDFLVGTISLHPSHIHFHIQSGLQQRLWTADASGAKTGSTPVRVGNKIGFCLSDIKQISEDAPPRTYYGEACRYPGYGREQLMGITRGWSDVYSSPQPGNFIEITGLPTGRYVLETVMDPDGLYLESDETDNVRFDPIYLCDELFQVWSPSPVDAREACA